MERSPVIARLVFVAGLAVHAQLAVAQRRLDVSPGGAFHSVTAAVVAARSGDTILVHPGLYREPQIVVGKRLAIVGDGEAVLDGEGKHGLLLVTADDVTIRGLVLRNVGTAFVEDRAAIRVNSARGCSIEQNRIENGFFGIYLATAVLPATCFAQQAAARPNRGTASISGRLVASRSSATRYPATATGSTSSSCTTATSATTSAKTICAMACTSCTRTTADT
jgi:hypothetical protein